MKLLLAQVLLALAVTDPSPAPSEPVCVTPSAASVPVAQAVAGHPQLSTLSKTVSLSGLPLDDASAVTVFAPTDAAFERLNPEDLASILSDNVTLANLLTYHVVPQNLTPEQLPGTHQTMQGSSLTVTEDGLVNETARIVCEAVPATNGMIYLIDAVLQPGS